MIPGNYFALHKSLCFLVGYKYKYIYIYIYILYIYIFIYTYIYVYIYAHNWIELNQKRTHIYIYNTLCIHIQIYIARIERKRRPPELFKD